MTQCVLFPGADLHLDDFIIFYKKNFNALMKNLKRNH